MFPKLTDLWTKSNNEAESNTVRIEKLNVKPQDDKEVDGDNFGTNTISTLQLQHSSSVEMKQEPDLTNSELPTWPTMSNFNDTNSPCEDKDEQVILKSSTPADFDFFKIPKKTDLSFFL